MGSGKTSLKGIQAVFFILVVSIPSTLGAPPVCEDPVQPGRLVPTTIPPGGTPPPPMSSGTRPMEPRVGGVRSANPNWTIPRNEPQDPPTPIVSIKVRVPSEAVPNEELTYRILLENPTSAPAHRVVVKNPLPSHVRFVRATPEPSVMSPELQWQVGTLPGGARKEITLVVVPTGEGDIKSSARVQFDHGQTLLTRISKPGLRVRVNAPAEVPLFDPVVFRIEVANSGRSKLAGVTVTNPLPEGLEFLNSKPSTRGDSPLTWDLGSLEPGQIRTIEFTAVAKKAGSLSNKSIAQAQGMKPEEAIASLKVGEAKLLVTKTGPARRLVERPTKFRIQVQNVGDLSANKVEICNEIPTDEMTFLGASDGGRMGSPRAGMAEIRWSLGTLAPKEKKVVEITLRARRAGLLKNVATVTADRGLSELARTETKFEDSSSLAIEMEKSMDPVEVGQEGTLVIRLLNRSRTPESKVSLFLTIPEGIKVLNVHGPTMEKTDRQRILFDPLPQLDPGSEPVYTIRFKVERIGPFKLKAEATSEKIALPVAVEEEIQVLMPK